MLGWRARRGKSKRAPGRLRPAGAAAKLRRDAARARGPARHRWSGSRGGRSRGKWRSVSGCQRGRSRQPPRRRGCGATSAGGWPRCSCRPGGRARAPGTRTPARARPARGPAGGRASTATASSAAGRTGRRPAGSAGVACVGAVADAEDQLRRLGRAGLAGCRGAAPVSGSKVRPSGRVAVEPTSWSGPLPPVAASASVYGRPAIASGSVSGVVIASAGASSGVVALARRGGRSTALGSRAMMTIVSSRMNSKAPVSLVTTTATNESSPEPPNSRPACPLRRDRRMPSSGSMSTRSRRTPDPGLARIVRPPGCRRAAAAAAAGRRTSS